MQRIRFRFWLLLGLTILVVGISVFTDLVFVVRNIEVFGGETLTRGQIEELSGVWRGQSLIWLPIEDIENRLLADPRISQAHVARLFPSTVRIRVREGIGIAVLPYHIGFVELDGQGVVVSVVANFSQVNLPIITGINLSDVAIGETATGDRLSEALAAIVAVPSNVKARLSELNVSAQGELTLTTVDGIRIVVGTSEGVADRLALLTAVLYAYDVRGLTPATTTYIDMTGEVPVFKGR